MRRNTSGTVTTLPVTACTVCPAWRSSAGYTQPVRHWFIHWLLKAVAILVVSRVLPGIQVSGFGAAFIAAAVIGIASATLGIFLKIVLFPFAILTLGLVYVLVNGLMLKVASEF